MLFLGHPVPLAEAGCLGGVAYPIDHLDIDPDRNGDKNHAFCAARDPGGIHASFHTSL